MLQQLQSLVDLEKEPAVASSTGIEATTSATAATSSSMDPAQLAAVQSKLAELRDVLDHSAGATAHYIDALRRCSSNPGSNYYWLIFVALYGGIYFMQ